MHLMTARLPSSSGLVRGGCNKGKCQERGVEGKDGFARERGHSCTMMRATRTWRRGGRAAKVRLISLQRGIKRGFKRAACGTEWKIFHLDKGHVGCGTRAAESHRSKRRTPQYRCRHFPLSHQSSVTTALEMSFFRASGGRRRGWEGRRRGWEGWKRGALLPQPTQSQI